MTRKASNIIRILGSAFIAASLLQAAVPLNTGSPRFAVHAYKAKPLTAVHDQRYQLIEIQIPGVDPWTSDVTPLDINNRGTVSIIITNFFPPEVYTVLLFKDGTFRKIQHPGSTITSMIASNDGILFGNWGEFDRQTAGVYNPATDRWTALPDISGKPLVFGQRMNDAGRAIGQACEGVWYGNFNCVGWSWDPIRHQYDFPAAPDAATTWPQGINNAGRIVGTWSPAPDLWGDQYGYLQDGDDFETIPPDAQSNALDINARGDILVQTPVEGCLDCFWQQGIWTGGRFNPLPSWSEPAIATFYLGLNDSRDGAGFWWEDNFLKHPFIAIRNQ